jgi:RimJ/RimL family protein N-acetyltransferase
MFTVRLESSDRRALLVHFLTLGNEDRRLRFGFIARDTSIERYVMDIDFDRDAVFGVQSSLSAGRQFDGITHLALGRKDAEIGVSVVERTRGKGIGSALVSRAAVHARNRGIEVLFMQCLSENRAIMRIARSLGMKVVTVGSDSEASLSLPAADALSIAREMTADQIALCDAALCEVLSPRADHAPTQPEAGGNRVAA